MSLPKFLKEPLLLLSTVVGIASIIVGYQGRYDDKLWLVWQFLFAAFWVIHGLYQLKKGDRWSGYLSVAVSIFGFYVAIEKLLLFNGVINR